MVASATVPSATRSLPMRPPLRVGSIASARHRGDRAADIAYAGEAGGQAFARPDAMHAGHRATRNPPAVTRLDGALAQVAEEEADRAERAVEHRCHAGRADDLCADDGLDLNLAQAGPELAGDGRSEDQAGVVAVIGNGHAGAVVVDP